MIWAEHTYIIIYLFMYDFSYFIFICYQSIPFPFYVKRFELSKETALYKN